MPVKDTGAEMANGKKKYIYNTAIKSFPHNPQGKNLVGDLKNMQKRDLQADMNSMCRTKENYKYKKIGRL